MMQAPKKFKATPGMMNIPGRQMDTTFDQADPMYDIGDFGGGGGGGTVAPPLFGIAEQFGSPGKNPLKAFMGPPNTAGQKGNNGYGVGKIDMASQRFTAPIAFREKGGPVKKKRSYVVGEKGPEVFVPDDDGEIIPHTRLPEFDLMSAQAPQKQDPPINPNSGPIRAGQRPSNPGVPGLDAPATVSGNTDDIRMTSGLNPSDQQSAGNLSTSTAPQKLDPYDKARADYDAATAAPVEKQSAWKQGLFWALQGLEKFGDNLSGVKNDKPVQWLGQAKHDYNVNKAGAALAPMEAQRQRDIANQAAIAKAQGEGYEAVEKKNKAKQSFNPILKAQLEQKVKDGLITPEDAEIALQAGMGAVVPGDNRDYETIEQNGKVYQTPKKGVKNYTETNAPVDPTKTPIQRTLKDGTPYFTTGNQAANNEALESYRQAQMDMEAGKFNINQFNDYTDKLQKWAEAEDARGKEVIKKADESTVFFNKAGELEIQVQKDQTTLDALKANPRFDRDPDLQKQARDIEKGINDKKTDIAEFKAKSNQLINEAQNLKPIPKPTAPSQQLQSPSIRSQRVNGSQIQKLMEMTGKSREEILKWAKTRGVEVID